MSNVTENSAFSAAAFDHAEDILLGLLGGGSLHPVAPPPAKTEKQERNPHRNTLVLMDRECHIDYLWCDSEGFFHGLAWRAQRGDYRNIPVRNSNPKPGMLTERQFYRKVPVGALAPHYIAVSYWEEGGELSLKSIAVVKREHINALMKEKAYRIKPYYKKERKQVEELVTIDWQEFIDHGYPILIYPDTANTNEKEDDLVA